MNYRPLPEAVTIGPSTIDGLGVFAKERIEAGTALGPARVLLPDGSLIRTALGGFVNHSGTSPNCEIRADYGFNFSGYIPYLLFTLKAIESGEELTVKYTLYNPEEINEVL